MEILEFQKNTYLVGVNYNRGIPNFLRIHVDDTLADLKHQLSQLNGRLHFGDARRVTDVEYRRLSIFSNRTVLFTYMKHQNDGDIRTMFSIFYQYMTNGPIKLVTTLVRSVHAICSNLIRELTLA
jgi:hypothetical protein